MTSAVVASSFNILIISNCIYLFLVNPQRRSEIADEMCKEIAGNRITWKWCFIKLQANLYGIVGQKKSP